MRTLLLLIALAAITIAATVAAPVAPARAAFPGANGKIAFQTNRDVNLEIYGISANGTGEANISNSSSTPDGEPSWSASGTKIAFMGPDSSGLFYDIYVMNANGTGRADLSNAPTSHEASPAWSPDGSKIAFSTQRDGNYEIYVMNADGTGQTNISNQPGSDQTQPAWSPDGTKIAYVSNEQLGFDAIYVMNADGSGKTYISPTGLAGSPDWSPDGTKIAFQQFVGSFPYGAYDVYVMNADGSDLTNLTNNAAQDESPAWSPDGTQIAFLTNRDGNDEIYTMNPDGSGVTRVTNNAGSDRAPDWQPVTTDTDGDGLTDALETQVFGTDENNADTDGDGCIDGQESVFTPDAQLSGGRRDPNNPYDYFNPTNDGQNRIDDILAVIERYYSTGDPSGPLNTIPPAAPAYHPKFDRTPLGANVWNLAQGDGHIGIGDILAIIGQYFHDCGSGIVKVAP